VILEDKETIGEEFRMRYQEKLEYLSTEVETWIGKKERQVNSNRRRAFVVRIASAVLGALVTICLGLRLDTIDDQLLRNLALVFGSLIAVVNAVESFSRDRALWIGRQITLLKLFDLREQIAFLKAGLDEGEEVPRREVDRLFESYRAVWQSASAEWERLFREEQEAREEDTAVA
jgi:hypothetical protein